ncbi:TonB-dependent receptor plug domain-containing protein [Flavobacteriaceae bacterium Ap0902]|nr:TonB-dependent receptor plug domain-containing protein [Flavobacteriaceae bacterium Ap0902]
MLKVTALIAVLGISNAQEVMENDSIHVQLLDDMVITATRKPQQISNIPGTVWVVPKAEIIEQAKSGVPLKEMLGNLVPGLDVGSQGRSNFGQNMRGRATLVMIDGVSLNSLRGVSRQFDAIDPFNIDRIEVVSGSSSIYGGNATGGIINIITAKAKKEGFSGQTELGARTGFMGEDDLDYKLAQSLGWKDDKLSVNVGVAYQKNGAAYDANNNRITPDITQTDLQYNESVDVMGSMVYQINRNHNISVTGQYYNSAFDGDASLSLGENFGAVLTANPDLLSVEEGFKSPDRIGTNRYLGTLSYKGSHILGDQDLFIQVATRGEFLGFYPFPKLIGLAGRPIPVMSASEQNTRYTTAKAVLVKDFGALNFTYGADADFENFDATQNVYDVTTSLASGGLVNEKVFETQRYPDIDSKSYAGFVQAEYQILPQLKLNAGLRYQNMDVEVSDFKGSTEQIQAGFGYGRTIDDIPGGNSSYDAFLGNVGFLYNNLNNSQVWATFTQGINLADPAKFYGVGSYAFNPATENWDLQNSINVDDQPLEGIVTDQYEVGFRTKHEIFDMQIAGFYSISDKNIGINNDGTRLSIFVEELNLRNLGLEAKVSIDLPEGFYTGFNALLIKSQLERDNQWQNQSIFTASPSKFASHIGYRTGSWNLRLQNLQSFKLEDEDTNVIDAYNTTDLMIAYTLPFGQINLSTQNLFNTDYQTVWSHRAEALYGPALPVDGLFRFNGRGRTFNLSFTYDF